MRSAPTKSSPAPVTVTVCAVLQSAVVKVSGDGLTVALPAAELAGVTVTGPVGSAVSATSYVAAPVSETWSAAGETVTIPVVTAMVKVRLAVSPSPSVACQV